MRLPFYYLVYAFRRLMGATGRDDIREWRARVALLVMEAQLTFCVIWILRGELLDLAPPIATAAVIVLPFLILNERVLSDRRAWRHYSQEFERWSVGKRRCADVGVAIFVAAVLVAPFVIRTLQTHRPWWS